MFLCLYVETEELQQQQLTSVSKSYLTAAWVAEVTACWAQTQDNITLQVQQWKRLKYSQTLHLSDPFAPQNGSFTQYNVTHEPGFFCSDGAEKRDKNHCSVQGTVFTMKLTFFFNYNLSKPSKCSSIQSIWTS